MKRPKQTECILVLFRSVILSDGTTTDKCVVTI